MALKRMSKVRAIVWLVMRSGFRVVVLAHVIRLWEETDEMNESEPECEWHKYRNG